MLNKEICKLCYQYTVHLRSSLPSRSLSPFDCRHYMFWHDDEDILWNKGYVFCYVLNKKLETNIKPPRECVFILEQLMKEQENAE